MREDYPLPFLGLEFQLDGHAGQGDDLAGGIAKHMYGNWFEVFVDVIQVG